MSMTRTEERLGILADGRTVSEREIQVAKAEASEVVRRLRESLCGLAKSVPDK